MIKPSRLFVWLTVATLLLSQMVRAQAPDDWKNFTAAQYKNQVALSWETFAEYNSKEFMIQHSVGGQAWSLVGSIPASGQSGTVKMYKYIHTTPVAGTNFYRIVLVNESGRAQFSRAVQIEFEETVPLKIYPNPVVNGILNLQMSSEAEVIVFTRHGKAVLQKHCKAGKSKLYVNDLPTGLYQVKAGDEVRQFFIR